MAGGYFVDAQPEEAPQQSQSPGEEEGPSPTGPYHHERNQGRRHHSADARSAIKHAEGEGPLSDGKPFRHRFRRGRESTAFSHSQRKPEHTQPGHTMHRALRRASQ